MRRCHHLVDGPVDGARAPRAPRHRSNRPRRASPISPMSRSSRSTSARSPRPSTRTRLRTRPRSPSSTRSTAPRLLRQGPQGRPGARRALPEVSADAKTITFTPADAQVQQRRPDRRRRLRLRLEAARSTRAPRRRTPTSWPRSWVPRTSLGPRRRQEARHRRTPTSRQPSTRSASSAPDDKTFVVKLTKPATYFLDVVALWIAVPVQEKWITSPNATEAANYVGSGPFMLRRGTTTARSSSSRTRTGTATRSRP